MGLGFAACGNVERGSDSSMNASVGTGGSGSTTTTVAAVGASSTTGTSTTSAGGFPTVSSTAGVGGTHGVGGTVGGAGDSGAAGVGGADSCADTFEPDGLCDTEGETCPTDRGCCACLPAPACSGAPTLLWQCVALETEPLPVCAAGPPTPGASCSSSAEYCSYCSDGIPSVYACRAGLWDEGNLIFCL